MRIIILLIILIIGIAIFYWYYFKTMTFLESPLDKRYYMVRDLSDKTTAVIMLSTIRLNILKLNDYLVTNKDNDKYNEYKSYIEQLNDRIKSVSISESRESSASTSYSVNKGEELVFCLRSKKEWNKFHNFNTIMYVALHEISHIACPEYGHGELFKKIFAFITKVSIEINIYTLTNFSKTPEEYCGIYITESII
jgi:hypothetical protein